MRKLLLTVCLLGILCAGCVSEVYLSPRYQQAAEMSAVNVRGMLKDCQAGNQKSCEEGLKKAADFLDSLIDASYGRESK